MSNNGTVIVNETEQTVVVNETETTVVVRSPGPAGASAGGTVSSVDVSGGSTGLTFSGGPVTLAGTITMAGTLDVDNGGTGATTAANARANLSAAVLGANNDITSMSAVTGGIATPTYIDFDAAGAADAVRRLAWNPDTGTAQIGLVGGNVQAELGQQLYAYVHNAESTQINKGQPVYLYQATGNKASVKLAYNTSDATSAKTLGLAAENIAQGANGLVICQGVLGDINTGSYSEGDTLYLGATAGTLTATKPKAPNHMVYIGVVERANSGNGQIYVRIQNGYELDEIHDVQINAPANGQLIIYDASTGLWKNANITAGTGISITNGAGSITISAPEVGTVTSVGTGTGLSGGPITSTGTISLANTAVSAGSYGSASAVPTFTVDAQGRLTAASNTNIAIANTAVSGLGTMSTQNANNVAITGGSVSGITDLAVADGGTGASDAPTARSNLGAAASATTISAGTGLSGGGDLSANRTISLANTAVSAGSYGSATQSGTFTVDAQGRLTAASNVTVTPAFSSITGKPTTLSGYGITDAINSSEKGAANGVATLGSDSKIPSSQVPAIAITDTFVVASQAAMLALSTAEKGDVAVRTDINKTFILTAAPYSTLANWQELLTPTDAVSSVNGETGVVVLDAADVGAPPTTRTITAGTGLSGGGDLSANRTISLANTAVSAGSYGSASAVPTFTVDGQGRLTAASNTNIAIANTAVSGLGTMSTQNANSVAITGGAIDGTAIGGTTRAAGNFTTLDANGNVTLGDATSDTVTITGTVQPGVVISGSSSNDALRITQTGAGNALVVEDSTNPDTSPFVIDTSGNLIQGYTTAINNWNLAPDTFALHATASNARPSAGLYNWSSNTARVGTFSMYKSVSNIIGTQGAIGVDQQLGRIAFCGDDGTSFVRGAEIFAAVDGTIGTNDMPGRLVFLTTADGASSPTARLTIASDGKVSVTNGYATITSNSTSAALTVTQTGTGNALVVEDSANPDATPFVVDTNGRVIAGGSTAYSANTVAGKIQAQSTSTFDGGFLSSIWSADANGTFVGFAKSRGATIGTQTVVNSNDSIGVLQFSGSDGTQFVEAARITVMVDGAPGTNDMPGRIVFATTADGASFPTERMRIDSAGNALIGTTTNSNSSRLTVNGTISETVSSTQYLVASQYDIGTDPNEIPLNQYLGTMAYQDDVAITVGTIVSAGQATIDGLAVGQGGGNVATNTAFGVNALNANTTGAGNVAVGASVLLLNTFGTNNVAVGYQALDANTTGNQNVGIGTNALGVNTTGGNNVAVGHETLAANTTGINNVAVGYQSLLSNTIGVNNVAVGVLALRDNTTGVQNVAVGRSALLVNTIGTDNVAVGYLALDANTTGVSNVAIGSNALGANTTGTGNVAVGHNALLVNTTGVNNVAIGVEALDANTTGTNNTAVGSGTLSANTFGGSNVAVGTSALGGNTEGSNNVAVGRQALLNNITGVNNIAIGRNALLLSTTGSDNVAIGTFALDANTTGVNNVAIGTNALGVNTTGLNNVAIGLQSLDANTTGVSNVGIGSDALGANTIGVRNIAIGVGALLVNDVGTDNVAIGVQALDANTTGAYNVGIGTNALGANTIGTNNVAVGVTALRDNTTGINNTALGSNTLQANTIGTSNVAVGTNSLLVNTTGTDNVAVGAFALDANTGGTSNVAVGHQSLTANTTGIQNIAVGRDALGVNTTGTDNVAVGAFALDANTTGVRNVGIGSNALGANTFGDDNVAVGHNSLDANTTGISNVAVGRDALGANTIGTNNTAVGRRALDANTTGVANTAFGRDSLLLVTTGQNNIGIGFQAGDTITTGSNNTIVGHAADSGSATAASRIVLGRDVTGTADNRITIGSGANIAELDLDGADTTWAASSDARLKENVQESLVGLGLINDLRVVNFQWKRKRDIDPALSQYEDSDERVHGEGDKAYLGFIAQEAQAALDAHNADTVRLVRSREDGILTTAPAALVPVLVRAIQELSARVEQLERK